MIRETGIINRVCGVTGITIEDMIIVPVDMKNIIMDIEIVGTAPDITTIKSNIGIEIITSLGITAVKGNMGHTPYFILVFKHTIGFCIL